MPLTFNSERNIDEMLSKLNSAFPDFRIKKKTNRTIYIRNGRLLSVVKVNSKTKLVSVYGDLNMADPVIILWIFIGLLLTIVGLIIIFTILYLINNNRIKEFRQEIYDVIVNE